METQSKTCHGCGDVSEWGNIFANQAQTEKPENNKWRDDDISYDFSELTMESSLPETCEFKFNEVKY